MEISKRIAQQLGRPGSAFGWLVGFIWNRRNAALNNTVLSLLDVHPTDRIVDIGFGGGYLLRRMADIVSDGTLAGVDVSPAMVAAARNRYAELVQAGKLDLRCASVEALPYPENHFNKACSVNSIFYWPDEASGVGEIHRVLQPDGRFVLCFTCKSSIENRGFARNIQLYETDEVVRLMSACGFTNIQINTAADRHRAYAVVTGSKAG